MHWCTYTCIVLQWICSLCGIIDWLPYLELTGWNVVEIPSLVLLVLTIDALIIPLSRPHSAYLHEKQAYEIQFLFERYVWQMGSNNLAVAHGGDLLAKSQIYWRITIHSGQFDGNSMALRKSKMLKGFLEHYHRHLNRYQELRLSKWVRNAHLW